MEIDIIAEQLMASSFHLSIIYHLSLTVIVHHLTFSVLNSVNFNFLIFGAKIGWLSYWVHHCEFQSISA